MKKPSSNELANRYNPQIIEFLDAMFGHLKLSLSPEVLQSYAPHDVLKFSMLLMNIYKVVNTTQAEVVKAKDPRYVNLENLLLNTKDPVKAANLIEKLNQFNNADDF